MLFENTIFSIFKKQFLVIKRVYQVFILKNKKLFKKNSYQIGPKWLIPLKKRSQNSNKNRF